MQETKQCQNCKSEFIIEPENFDFYKKIDVPTPTWCPECRLQRRLSFMNLMRLYKSTCALCKKDIISRYAPDSPFTVYCPDCWWSDKWSPLDYARDYDFSRPFFEQFAELWKEVPLLALSVNKDVVSNSPFTNHTQFIKNCYFVFLTSGSEDCAYGFYIVDSRFTLDSSMVMNSEFCYDSMHVYKCNRCVGTRSQVTESMNCFFLKDCMNCQDCFASANLRGKKYYIFNKPYSKEEYFKKIGEWDLGSYETYQKVQKMAEEHWKTLPPKPNMDEFTTGCTGSHIFQSKNCKECYEVTEAENSKFLFAITGPVKDSYDLSRWGGNQDMCYECSTVGDSASGVLFSEECGHDFLDGTYCKLSTSSSNHFGCVSVRSTDYCIFNKRYQKEEYLALRKKIINQMNEKPYTDKEGRTYRYGEFFPMEMSPFPYNDTAAQSLFPLSEEEAVARGLGWSDFKRGRHAVTKHADDLPDHIKDVPSSITDEIVGCKACGNGFKVIRMELDFLKEMNLPLPRTCPQCRIESKFNQWLKNLRVFERTCSQCGDTFQTSYPEEEVENILCKECYRKEVI